MKKVFIALVLLALSPCARAQQGAMIFGSDTVASPTTTLPTSNNEWFTNGNGTSTQGTQAPDYWFNKVGAEINNAITGAGLQLSMTNYSQLSTVLQSLFLQSSNIQAQVTANAANVPQLAKFQTSQGNHGVQVQPMSHGVLNLSSGTAAQNEYCLATASVNLNQTPTYSVELDLTDSLDSAESQDTTYGSSQFHQISMPVAAGQSVTVTATMTAGSGSYAGLAATERLSLFCLPVPQQTSFP